MVHAQYLSYIQICYTHPFVYIVYVYRKKCKCATLFLQSIINIVIQVLFPNLITYLDRTFKEEQNGLNFKIK